MFKRRGWWNTPNYTYVWIGALLCACAGLFFMGMCLYLAFIFLCMNGSVPTMKEMFLFYIIGITGIWFAFMLHRYDRIISPRMLRQLIRYHNSD